MDPDMLQSMGKLGSILLATDGSDFCKNAIREAIALAKTSRTKLTALNVLEIRVEVEGRAVVEKGEVAIRQHLDEILGMASRENVECEAIIRRHGPPAAVIVEEAKKRDSDVIVMGKRGRTSFFFRASTGSVTAKVIASAPSKTLVVPETNSAGAMLLVR